MLSRGTKKTGPENEPLKADLGHTDALQPDERTAEAFYESVTGNKARTWAGFGAEIHAFSAIGEER